jgi:hypothetical protein
VNTLPATLAEGGAYRWCWDSRTARFRPATSNSYTFFIMHVADIESVSTPSMTYCVVINVQIILIRVVQRAQSKTALRTNISDSEPEVDYRTYPQVVVLERLVFPVHGPPSLHEVPTPWHVQVRGNHLYEVRRSLVYLSAHRCVSWPPHPRPVQFYPGHAHAESRVVATSLSDLYPDPVSNPSS